MSYDPKFTYKPQDTFTSVVVNTYRTVHLTNLLVQSAKCPSANSPAILNINKTLKYPLQSLILGNCHTEINMINNTPKNPSEIVS